MKGSLRLEVGLKVEGSLDESIASYKGCAKISINSVVKLKLRFTYPPSSSSSPFLPPHLSYLASIASNGAMATNRMGVPRRRRKACHISV